MTLTSMRQMVLEIFHLIQSQEFGQDGWTSPFSLKYDVTDAMLQDNEKMKVQYLRSLLFNLFETLQAIGLFQKISTPPHG